MTKRHLNPPTLFPSLQHGFSQIVVASGTETVFVSGQVAWDADKRIVGRSLGEQTTRALRNVQTAVEAAGGSMRDVVSLRIYIVENAKTQIADVGAALRAVFPADPPTTSWIGVAFLADPEFLVEIEAVAVLGWVTEG